MKNLFKVSFLIIALFITGSLQAQEFEAIKVSGIAVVHYTQGTKTNIKVTVAGMPRKDVITKVENGVLIVTTRGNHSGETIDVQVTAPAVKTIEVDDAAEFYSKKIIKAEALKIAVHGSGAAEVKLDVENLSVYMNGGDLRLAGKVNKQKVTRSQRSEHGELDDYFLTVRESK